MRDVIFSFHLCSKISSLVPCYLGNLCLQVLDIDKSGSLTSQEFAHAMKRLVSGKG